MANTGEYIGTRAEKDRMIKPFELASRRCMLSDIYQFFSAKNIEYIKELFKKCTQEQLEGAWTQQETDLIQLIIRHFKEKLHKYV